MNPKQKAEELANKFDNVARKTDYFGDDVLKDSCKICALICVDEIIKVTHYDNRANSVLDKEYWEKVKQEIIK